MTRLIDANVLKEKIRNWSDSTGCDNFTIFHLNSFVNDCDCAKTTIKEYASMPEVLIDGRVFVDREVFRGYALNLLQQELDTAMSDNEDIGLRVAMSVISGIR